LAALRYGTGGLDGKARALAPLLQEVEVTGAITTETEVVTNLQMLYAEAIDQDLLNEFVGTEFAQAAVEGQAQHPVHTLLFQQRQLVTQTGQAWRCALRREVLTRLGLEYHHAAGQPDAGGMGPESLENGLMTGVHARSEEHTS